MIIACPWVVVLFRDRERRSLDSIYLTMTMNAYDLVTYVKVLPSPCADYCSRCGLGHDQFGQLLGHAARQHGVLLLQFMRHLKDFVFLRIPVTCIGSLPIAILELGRIRSAQEISDAVSHALTFDGGDFMQRTLKSLFTQESQGVGHVDYGVPRARLDPSPLSRKGRHDLQAPLRRKEQRQSADVCVDILTDLTGLSRLGCRIVQQVKSAL